MNKTDLVDPSYLGELDAVLRELNEMAPILHSEYAEVDFEGLLDTDSPWSAGTEPDETPPPGIVSVSLRADGIYDGGKIKDYLEGLSGSLLRAKGFIETEGGPVVIQYSGSGLSMEPDVIKDRRNAGILVLTGSFGDVAGLRKRFSLCSVGQSMTI